MYVKMNILLRSFFLVALLSGSNVAAECNPDTPPYRPDDRYIQNTDGTVTDRFTGLMWKQCPEGLSSSVNACDKGYIETYTWQMALEHVEAMNRNGGFAGYTDWRLPDHKELFSLVDHHCYDPAINSRIFPEIPSSMGGGIKQYLTSSPYMEGDINNVTAVRTVSFLRGEVGNVRKTEVHFLLLVRGP